tara:strand:- start:513 stop:674 length:162 start_codon:yes stop_codon:yes gene_type:complete
MKKLTKRQQDTLKKHSKHHSTKHMKEMKVAMTRDKNRLTFSQAHKLAIKKVGT